MKTPEGVTIQIGRRKYGPGEDVPKIHQDEKSQKDYESKITAKGKKYQEKKKPGRPAVKKEVPAQKSLDLNKKDGDK
jgi:hypothetical protein